METKQMMPLNRRTTLLAACAAAFATSARSAPDYPAKASRIVVPLGAGASSIDQMARAIAAGLTVSLGHPFVIDNKAGAAGQIAADAVAKSPGDPYTLFMGSMGIMSISPSLYPSLPYDVGRDFTPIALCGFVPYALIINPAIVPVRTVAEFLAWAKAQKTPIAYGTAGSGSVSHIGAVMISKAAALSMIQVPYRANAPIITDLVKGDLQMVVDGPAPYMGLAAEGKLRILAVTSRQRLTALPDVPTMAEAGLPDIELANWFGIFGPRDLPVGVVERLRTDLAQVLQSKKLREQFAPSGLEIASEGGSDFAGFAGRDRARWQSFIRRNDIKLDKI
jgi:tripartite-type tricarboxylate transporter receptor subunit TctC